MSDVGGIMELRLLDSAFAPAAVVDRDEPRARFWRPFPRKGADVACGEVTVDEVSLHAHEAVHVLLPLSSFAVIGAAGQATVVHPGTIHVTAPFELRGARSLDGTPFSTRIILVGPSVLGTMRSLSAGRAQVASRQVVPPPVEPAPAWTDLVIRDRELYASLMDTFDALRRPLMTLSCESRLLECLSRLLRDPNRSATQPRRGAQPAAGVVRTRDHLRAYPAQNVTLDELATISGLSKFYLLRSFYRAYGLTPHAYQMQLRLARARRLLGEGRPLSHVTYDAGFADQSHLTRRFAAFYGLTPARYARQLGKPPGAAAAVTTPSGRRVTQPPAA
jgi:AraC-like DNA-binding protein